jgi:hypothetical protein
MPRCYPCRHQCHRVAAAHRRLLVGRSFQARSPNGRFADGAAAIHQRVLSRIEVHGKVGTCWLHRSGLFFRGKEA